MRGGCCVKGTPSQGLERYGVPPFGLDTPYRRGVSYGHQVRHGAATARCWTNQPCGLRLSVPSSGRCVESREAI